MDSRRGELADRLRRILLSGAGESDRFVSVFNGPVEDYSGSHHFGGFLDILGYVPERSIQMELLGCVWVHRGRGLLYVL